MDPFVGLWLIGTFMYVVYAGSTAWAKAAAKRWEEEAPNREREKARRRLPPPPPPGPAWTPEAERAKVQREHDNAVAYIDEHYTDPIEHKRQMALVNIRRRNKMKDLL